MQTAGIKIHVPVGTGPKYNEEPLYLGTNLDEKSSLLINYRLEVEITPLLIDRIKSAIRLINDPEIYIEGGVAELASMEATFLDLAEHLKRYRDAIIRKIAQQRNK